MKRFPAIPAVLLLAVVVVWDAHGQKAGPTAGLFTIKQGLSHTFANLIFQDSIGFLWIGTRDGLNKYDGYEFSTFRNLPFDTSSLSDNFIRVICEGQSGDLWIGTNKGLNRLDRKSGSFTRYIAGSDEQYSLKEDTIYGLATGTAGDIWIKTRSYLEQMDPVTGIITHHSHPVDRKVNTEEIIRMPVVVSPNGVVWTGAPEGLISFFRDSSRIHLYAGPGPEEATGPRLISAICPDTENKLWIGAASGLYHFSPAEERFRKINLRGRPYADQPVHALFLSGQNSLIVGLDRGFLKYDIASGQISRSSAWQSGSPGPPAIKVNSLLVDHSEIIWLASRDGLMKINEKENEFSILSSKLPEYSHLPSDDISAVLVHNDELWLGTAGKGLAIIDVQTGRTRIIDTYGRTGNAICDNFIHSLYKDPAGNIWIGTSDGVMIFSVREKVFLGLCDMFPGLSCQMFEHNKVYQVIQAEDGQYWFACSNGIYRLHAEQGVIFEINSVFSGIEMRSVRNVFTLLQDTTGHIWFGTDKGLIIYDPGTDSFEFIRARPNHPGSLKSDLVYRLFMDTRDRIWIGTASGLHLYEESSSGFRVYNEQDGLANNHVYSIIEDHDSMLWISTNNCLSRFDPERGEFSNYGISEGTQNHQYNLGASAIDQSGLLYFGGISGLNSFHPDSIMINPYIPNIAFTSFELVGKNGRLVSPLEKVSKIIIPRGNQVFSIHFSALDYTAPERNRYRYQMTRNDVTDTWIDIGNQHSVTFYNLRSGTYQFTVKGSNSDQKWNDQGTGITVIVPTPWWKSPEAYISYGLLGLTFIYLIVQYRTRTLRKSNRILKEKEVAARQVEKQKEELIIKNKNITDSINYGRRIQLALLPSFELFDKILPDSFILYKPKDIVSGDFYWINENGNKIFVGAVDCTGHGVPGAFVSIIGFELFRNITSDQGVSNPAVILDSLNDNFAQIFSDGEQVYLKDGMDLSLCVFDKKEKYLEFSGAFNPLYLIRDGSIIEIKADRFSIGADIIQAPSDHRHFKSHKLFLQKDDILYMFSDGYADQFGGPEGKKFKYRRFRHLLLTIHKLPVGKQCSILEASIEEWRKDADQVDDIMVIGIRPVFGHQPD